MFKRDLTQSIIAELDANIDLDVAHKEWWYKDIRDTNFRLSPKGYKFLCDKTPSYKFNIEIWANPKTFKELSFLNCPYYIENLSYYKSQIHEIVIFSDKIAMTARLYLNFETYLKTIQN